jgi:co-chaperonin GroES (HSP10)
MLNQNLIILLIVLGLLVFYGVTYKKNSEKEAALDKLSAEIKANLKGKSAFLCSGINLLGTNKEKTNVYLLGGDFVNIEAKAGMTISIDGQDYVITDVSDENGEPHEVIDAKSASRIGFVGINTNTLNLDTLNEKIKREKMLTFLIK